MNETAWIYFCATPLENWNNAPGRRHTQFGNHGSKDMVFIPIAFQSELLTGLLLNFESDPCQ